MVEIDIADPITTHTPKIFLEIYPGIGHNDKDKLLLM